MRTIHVNINGMFVQKDSKNGGVQGEGNASQLHITFDDSWKGYGKRIIWRNAQGQDPVSLILIHPADAEAAGDGDAMTYDTPIPAEPLKLPGWCSFTIEGYKDADKAAESPASAAFSVRDVLQVYHNDSYYSPAEPTPSEAQQILSAIEKNEETVGGYAKEAKSWAVGGTGSREGEDTDNAKYYAQSCTDSVTQAAESAAEAAASAAASKSSEQAAAGSASEAEQSATDAKGEVENAKQEVQNAENAAQKSESWAVGGTGTRPGEDTNNAKYWSDEARKAAGGGVASFNGRTGVVLPEEGDYTREMLGIRTIHFGPQTSGNAFAITAEQMDQLLSDFPPLVFVTVEGLEIMLMRYDKTSDTAYYSNSLYDQDRKRFVRLVAKGTSATVHSAEESQIPMPSGGGDNGKYLRVNAGGGFDLVSPDFFTKAETLKAATAALYGLDSGAVPDDILYILREAVIRRNGVLQTILGTKLKFLSVETGKYTGTGTYGSNNPTKITFSKIKPIIWGVICRSKGTSTRNTYVLPNIISWGSGEVPNFSLFDASTSVTEVDINYSEKTVSFYALGGESYQLNSSGIEYTYYGIGMEA